MKSFSSNYSEMFETYLFRFNSAFDSHHEFQFQILRNLLVKLRRSQYRNQTSFFLEEVYFQKVSTFDFCVMLTRSKQILSATQRLVSGFSPRTQGF